MTYDQDEAFMAWITAKEVEWKASYDGYYEMLYLAFLEGKKQ